MLIKYNYKFISAKMCGNCAYCANSIAYCTELNKEICFTGDCRKWKPKSRDNMDMRSVYCKMDCVNIIRLFTDSDNLRPVEHDCINYHDIDGRRQAPYYYAGVDGNIYSLSKRSCGIIAVTKLRPWKSPSKGGESYYKVGLYINGERKRYLVHKLIAEAWLVRHDSEDRLFVDHKNGDKKDNRPVNLAYVTQSENTKRVHRAKRKECVSMKGFKGWYVRNVNPKYTDISYRKLKELYISELMNTGCIEIPGYMTKSGNTLTWR